jgi:anti-anti-sigma factor
MSDLANLFIWQRDGVVVAGVTGEVDVSNAAQLEQAVAAELSHETLGLVMDLGGLEFMDSSGVHLLFHLARRLERRGLGFALVLPPDSIPRRVLELSGPRTGRWMHATEEAAIAAVRTMA